MKKSPWYLRWFGLRERIVLDMETASRFSAANPGEVIYTYPERQGFPERPCTFPNHAVYPDKPAHFKCTPDSLDASKGYSGVPYKTVVFDEVHECSLTEAEIHHGGHGT